MRRSWTGAVLLLASAWVTSSANSAESWPQFRGPQSAGLAVGSRALPSEIGPEKNVVWKTATPPGHSSPVITGNRIFMTAVRDEKLVTIGMDRATGKILWEKQAPHEKLETIHSIGSHAQPSPATDGKHVVSFFGSSGLYCYDTDGKLLWKRAMGPFNNDFGAGTSPIIHRGRVILCQDHDSDSFLIALDVNSGKTLWETDRSEFPRNYCSPVIWNVDGKDQIIVAATLRVVGYDFASGKELWTVRGISRCVCTTTVVGDDGNLYVAGWANGGDTGARISVDPFDQVIAARDKNKNGTIERDELTKGGDIERRYTQVDRDDSGSLTRMEYEYYRKLFDTARNVVLSIKPGAQGDATATHVLWEYRKFVPFCASPLYHQGLLFTVKDGGIVSCLDAKDGKPQKQARVPGTGNYYSSPVAGDGKIYLLDQRGKLTVIDAERDWKVLSTANFNEGGFATPAILDGKIYLRTAENLYCFAKEDEK